ncbi:MULTISPECIES: flagellar hook-length control protein FliK [unclassified Desulfovibrio]|uniref:flagellar hook-length control protein FliK n=1 Tax=unclassified Desulfovibrio TaxID=2593640 RepID=UPI0013EB26B8|nr:MULTISPECIES: flagellar hook-length control protein FliK [unclassified Desulfovibrio]
MQIMPTSSADASLGFFGSTSNSAGNGNGDFLQSMQDAMEAVDDGSELSVSAALEADAEAGRPVVESPYTRTTTDGVTYTLSEVCFTKQELAELRLQLVKEGAPEEALKQFDILASQPNGATLAQVMASLRVAGNAPSLNEEDEHAIIALLGQIDPTGDLAQDVLAKMRDGNGEAALELIAQGFASMDAGSTIEISIEDALALGRGLGLDTGSLMNLAGNFGGFPALKVTAEQFGNLMAPATAQLTQQRANQEKLDAAVEKTLKPIISKARDRMEKEKAASELENRRVQQSRILIDRTVQEKSRGILDETLAADAQAADRQQASVAEVMSRKADAEKSAMVGHAGKEESASRRPGAEAVENASRRQNVAETAQERQAGAASNAEGARNTAVTRDMGNDARHGADDSAARDSKDNKNPEWNELLGKVETRAAAPAQPTTAASGSFLYTMLQGGQNIPDAVPAQDAGQLPQISRQVAQQVEQGMLTAMRDGATRLDLQLHPAELGAITITLVARNGEVSAQIRSEKSETAEMVSRQLDTIRVNLEQQGIKVDKIEVQMENSADQNPSTAWQDLGQHNARQEEDARREELARLRNLATVRNNSRNSEPTVLEQPVHISGQTARYAGQAMHLVA